MPTYSDWAKDDKLYREKQRMDQIKSTDACGTCEGVGIIGWWPDSDGPDKDVRVTVACPKCHPEQFQSELGQINKTYSGRT